MPKSEYRARAVRKKTREVVDYHNDDQRPGKPLHLLIPGGAVALASLGLIGAVIYQTWVQHEWVEGSGIGALIVLVPVYIGGVFVFSYGYELYDMERAIKLTALIVFISLAAVVIVAVLACLLGASKDGGSSSGGSNGGSKSSGSKSSSGSSSSSTSSGSSFGSGGGGSSSPIFVDLFSGSTTSNSSAPAAVEPPKPQPIVCSFCDSEYIPEENQFTCPKCGASSKTSEPDPETEGNSEET